jgi:hypothetical protein
MRGELLKRPIAQKADVKKFIATTDSDLGVTVRHWAALQKYADQQGRTAEARSHSTPPTQLAPRPSNDSCERDSISTVSNDGAFIATLTGGRYIIDDVDRTDTILWLETDDVVVCESGYSVKLIHDNEVVHGHAAR